MTDVTEPEAPPTLEPFDLDSLYETAELLVRDILQAATAEHLDDRTRAVFCERIVNAWLALPTAAHVERLCRAAGFASAVDPDTLKARVDELHATNHALLHELQRWSQRYAVLRTAAQAVVETWERGALAEAVQQLAALIPK